MPTPSDETIPHGAERAVAPRPGDSRRHRAVGDRAMRRAAVIALIVGLVLDLIVLAIALARGEGPAVNGALIGTGLTLVIIVPTLVITIVGARMSPLTMAATVLGSWAGKMLIVILVLVLVKDLAAVSSLWIGLALLVGAVPAITIEGVLMARSRQPLYVDPREGPTEDSRDRAGA